MHNGRFKLVKAMLEHLGKEKTAFLNTPGLLHFVEVYSNDLTNDIHDTENAYLEEQQAVMGITSSGRLTRQPMDSFG